MTSGSQCKIEKMKNTIKVLNELKDKGLIKDYAIGGAIAALKYVSPFFTEYLDIFIILQEEQSDKKLIVLSPIYEYFEEKGYRWEKHWIIIEGVPVDIFPADELEKEAIENAVHTNYEEIPTKVITPEYLIALFLRASREKDVNKINMILQQANIDETKLYEILEKYNLIEKFKEFKEKRYGR